MAEIELHLRIRVHAGGAAALREFLREAIPFYESPGDIHVRLLKDRDHPDRFIEVIEYATERAYLDDQHRVEHDEEMLTYLSRWHRLLAEPPVVEIYQALPRSTVSDE